MLAVIEISSPPLQLLSLPLFEQHSVSCAVLRLDLIHPRIHGNKWFKLRCNLEAAKARDATRLVSFGGAYSNHLSALAAAGQALGLDTVGVLRGELPDPLNPVLRFARECGMTLLPVSRSAYRQACRMALSNPRGEREQDPVFAQLAEQFESFYTIPEGGGNERAVEGCEEIANYLDWSVFGEGKGPRVVAMACATGTTLAGVVRGLEKSVWRGSQSPHVCGVAVLKAPGYLQAESGKWLQQSAGSVRWSIDERFHCGGYAKRPPLLCDFVEDFGKRTGIPVEPVYTGKLFHALCEQVERGEHPPGSQIIALHTGGIFSHA